MKGLWQLVRQTFTEWSEDKAARLAAALSYYTIFAIPPLLVITISIAGLVFDGDEVRRTLVSQFSNIVAPETATALGEMIDGAQRDDAGPVAAAIGVVALLLGASGVFGQLQDALNTIWEVTPKPTRGVMGLVRKRIVSFLMVLSVGFVLLVSLVISAVLSLLGEYLSELLPGSAGLAQFANVVISFVVITLLFALLYKYIPDAKVAWRDVWLGAVVTALLFTVGKQLIGLYLARSSFASTFGAAASVILILVWVYYTSQILFLGAEFTQVYANLYGGGIVPEDHARRTTERERAEEGLVRPSAE